MNRTIEVTVTPQGEVAIQTLGYVGTSCQEASRYLEQALGVSTSDRKTPDFYASIPQSQQQQQ